MQAYDARRELLVPRFGKPGLAQFLFKLDSRRKGADGVGQVAVGRRVFGKQAANAGQQKIQVHIVKAAPDALPPGAEFKNAGPSAGAQHAQHFGKGRFSRDDVAYAKGYGQAIHRSVGQGQAFGVSRHRQDAPGVFSLELAATLHQHGRAEIQRGHKGRGVLTAYGQGNIQRASGQIQHDARIAQANVAGQHLAPVLVKAQAENAVQQVVKAYNTAKHASHGHVMGRPGSLLRRGCRGLPVFLPEMPRRIHLFSLVVLIRINADGGANHPVDRRKNLGKVTGGNRARFNEFGGQFLGHLQGFLAILVHTVLVPCYGRLSPAARCLQLLADEKNPPVGEWP